MIRHFDIQRIRGSESERVVDEVAAEEPLAIHVNYWFKSARKAEPLAVLMRTPGADRELAAGFLLTEGIVRQRGDLVGVTSIGSDGNEVLAELGPDVEFECWRGARNSASGAACGVCGKRTIDAVRVAVPPLPEGPRFSRDQLSRFPELLSSGQPGFQHTGGLHAAALINGDLTVEAEFEDIGRHSALDKLIGWAFLESKMPLCRHAVMLSSRSSFELVQKCAAAGITVIATVGGPSSLAVEAAREYGITLIGFLSRTRANIYSGEWRLHS